MDTRVAAGCEEINWGGSAAEDGDVMNTTGSLSRCVHVGLPNPLTQAAKCSLVHGEYLYFHYGCDGLDDRGWGCGYRTIQTMVSWLCLNWTSKTPNTHPPSLPEIQEALVAVGDKPASFSGSRGWIGTFEASLVLDYFYHVPCKLVHIRGGGSWSRSEWESFIGTLRSTALRS